MTNVNKPIQNAMNESRAEIKKLKWNQMKINTKKCSLTLDHKIASSKLDPA